MKTEVKNNITYLYPDSGKRLKMLNGTDTYSVLILAKDDTQDNYEEVDSLWEPDLPEVPEVPEVSEVPAEGTSLPPESVPAMIEQPKRVFTVEQEEKLQAAMVQLEQQKAKRTKKTQQVENQLSLFDSVA